MIKLQRLAALAVISFSALFTAPAVYGAAVSGMERSRPILFEPVPGDASSMIGHAPGATAVFHSRSVAMHFEGKSEELGFSFPGAGTAAPSGALLEKSKTNYLLGSDPSQWRTRVPNYARVVYKELYPGIDAVFYGNGQLLEHDFIVSAGADYHQIRMRLSPNAHAALAADGSLTLSVADGALSMRRPVIYQDEPDGRRQRAGSFRMLPDGDIGFSIKSYDPRRALVIDPVLSFSTYLSKNASVASQIATDTSGNNYVAGIATLGFPVTPNAFPGCAHCTANTVVTFVSKLSPDGANLLYSTVLGGSGFAQPTGLAVDGAGNAVVSGWTGAADFPTRFPQPIAALSNYTSGYLVSLSPDGSALNYGTLLNASPASQATDTSATAIALDASGNAYVTGNTGNGFPVTGGALNGGGAGTYGNQFNVFLSKFSSTGALLYSAVVGSADSQNGGAGPIGASVVAVDADGNAYLAGQAGTVWPITSNAYRKQIAGSEPYAAPFVAKVAPDAKSLTYSTFLDYAYQATGLAVLPNGNVWIAGNSVGADFPTTPGAFQGNSAGGGGAFLTELNADGSALLYSTVIGNTFDKIAALAVEPDGDLWLAGSSSDAQFPLATPLQSVPPLPSGPTTLASTLMQFDPSGAQLKFSTLLGGTAVGYAGSVAVDSNHRAHVAGAASYGLYTTPGVYDGQVPAPPPALSGATYGYVALVDPTASAPAVCVSPNTGLHYGEVVAGAAAEVSLTLTSCGTEPLNVTSVGAGADVFTVPAAENGCTEPLPVGQSCTLKVRYSPTKSETDLSTLTIQSDASVSEAVLPLSGTGTVPVISVNGAPQFNAALVGQTGAGALPIQDTGHAPLVLDAAKTTASGDFSLRGLGGCGTPFTGGCQLQVFFTPSAPGTRTGVLTIASNDPATPSLAVQLEATGYAGAPTPQITTLNTQLVQAGSGQFNLNVQGFGFLPSSVIRINGVPQTTVFQSETGLSATLGAAAIPANTYGELAVTVQTPAPGGGTSDPYTLTEFQLLTADNTFLISEPVSKQLFVSSPASAAANPNTVLPIQPATATVGAPIPVGNNPGVLAASADGKYLYVALNGDHAIQRINLQTNAVERTFALPVDSSFGALQVLDMHVAPSDSTEVVASLISPSVSPSEMGLALFNDAGLVNRIPESTPGMKDSLSVDRFAFTGNPSTLYADTPFGSGFAEVGFGPSGASFDGAYCCTPPENEQFSFPALASDGALLYTQNGLVWDPAKSALVHSYNFPTDTLFDSVIPDLANNRTFFLDQFGSYAQYQAATVLAYDQTSLAETASLSFTGTPIGSGVSVSQLVRWGVNGFAFRLAGPSLQSSKSLILFTSSIASASNLTPTPAANQLDPASASANGADFPLTVNGNGFVSGSTVEWNGSPRLTTFVSARELTATIYAADIADQGTAQVSVESPGQRGGVSANLPFTVTAPVSAPGAPVATLAPASLAFTAPAVGSASGAQVVTLTNTGNASLTGITIGLAGSGAASFAQAGACGATLNAGSSCSINVVFTPVAAGAASASLTVQDNANGSPQSVSLSGTAMQPSFAIQTQAGGSAGATAAAGQAATYALVATPAQGYSGTLTLACGNLPTNASCIFTPATLVLSGGSPANFTLKVLTAQAISPTVALLRFAGFGSALAGLVLFWPGSLRRKRSSAIAAAVLLMCAVSAGLVGCGSSSHAPAAAPTQAAVAPGTYTIQVVASGGGLTQTQALSLTVE